MENEKTEAWTRNKLLTVRVQALSHSNASARFVARLAEVLLDLLSDRFTAVRD